MVEIEISSMGFSTLPLAKVTPVDTGTSSFDVN
jgi:hypothetical protein